MQRNKSKQSKNPSEKMVTLTPDVSNCDAPSNMRLTPGDITLSENQANDQKLLAAIAELDREVMQGAIGIFSEIEVKIPPGFEDCAQSIHIAPTTDKPTQMNNMELPKKNGLASGKVSELQASGGAMFSRVSSKASMRATSNKPSGYKKK